MTTCIRFSRPLSRSVADIARNVLFLSSLCLVGSASSVSAQTFAAGPLLTIDVRFDQHGISQDIYGMNAYGTDSTFPAFMKELKLPVSRSGGDATTRYNWLTDATNAGADFYFMAGGSATSFTPGGSIDTFVQANQANGTKSIVTIPIIDYINNIPATTWNCSFPVSLFGAQTAVNPYIQPFVNGVQTQAGNGISLATGADITLTTSQILRIHINNTPAFQTKWVQHLVSVNGTANNGGVGIYQLDNEPSGWGNTHRDVHPVNGTGYDELVSRSLAYGAAIKSVDPTAAVLGPSDFGWAVYEGGGVPGDDATAHGMGFADYYLTQMYQYDLANGKRLLDYFDEHYYPTPDTNGQAIALAPAGNANTQARRLESTRSLWDPTYVENNWIGQYYGPIMLLPLFHQWVNNDYPNTKIALTEYNFGGLESINGALTQADVLGIFGRQGLDLATMWGPPSSTQPGAYAFRIYRNYDGNGSQFGDISVRATSTNQSQLSVYAAQRSTDNAVTLVIINKTGSTLLSNLNLLGFKFGTTAKVYRYSSANLNAIVPQKDLKTTIYGFSTSYPPNSITLIVVPIAPPAKSVGI
jgi:hypothetical protein